MAMNGSTPRRGEEQGRRAQQGVRIYVPSAEGELFPGVSWTEDMSREVRSLVWSAVRKEREQQQTA